MKNIEVKKSSIHGSGVFLRESARAGELISFIKGDIKVKHNKNKKDALSNLCWVGVGKDTWIDPKYPFRYINHSCEPSAGIKGRVSLYALRDLRSGEEVTIDYSTTEGDSMWYMKCVCGSNNCRKSF